MFLLCFLMLFLLHCWLQFDSMINLFLLGNILNFFHYFDYLLCMLNVLINSCCFLACILFIDNSIGESKVRLYFSKTSTILWILLLLIDLDIFIVSESAIFFKDSTIHRDQSLSCLLELSRWLMTSWQLILSKFDFIVPFYFHNIVFDYQSLYRDQFV